MKYLVLVALGLLLASCQGPQNIDSRDVYGSFAIVDSANHTILDTLGGITVSIMPHGCYGQAIDSAVTEPDGTWRIHGLPDGDFDIVATRPGYSTFVHYLPRDRYFQTEVQGVLAAPMQHAVAIDSLHVLSAGLIACFGHDKCWQGPHAAPHGVMLCFDTVRGVPGCGHHLGTNYAPFLESRSHVFAGELAPALAPIPSTTADTLFITAYAISPLEGADRYDPLPDDFKTCGPPSNVIAVARK